MARPYVSSKHLAQHMSTLQKRLIVGIGVISVMALFIKHHYTETQLREENQVLRQQMNLLSNAVAQTELPQRSSLSLPSGGAHTAPIEGADRSYGPVRQQLQTNNVMARLLRGDPFRPKVAS